MGDRYSRDEVQAIMQRALDAQRTQSDEVSHDELVAIARDLGVAPADLEAAARTVREERDLEASRAAVRRADRQGLLAHAIPYVLVNLGLALTLSITHNVSGFIWCALGWGIGLAMHAWRVFWPDPQRFDARVRKHRDRARARAEHEALKADLRRAGAAVGAGVADVLHAVATAVEGAKQPAAPPSRVRVADDEGAAPQARAPDANDDDAQATGAPRAHEARRREGA